MYIRIGLFTVVLDKGSQVTTDDMGSNLLMTTLYDDSICAIYGCTVGLTVELVAKINY